MPNPYIPQPTTVELERVLLGACLSDTRGSRVWPTLLPEHFLLDRHQQIWTVLLDLTERVDYPDVLMLTHELARRDLLQAVGGVAYLAQCMDEGAAAADLLRYGDMIRREHTERLRVTLAKELMAHPEGSDRLAALLMAVEQGPGTGTEPIGHILVRLSNRERQVPIWTGWRALDAQLGVGLPILLVIGGRTSHGKTAFACQLAMSVARAGHLVDFFTLEETPERIGERMAAAKTGHSIWRLRESWVDTGDLQDLPIQVAGVKVPTEDVVVGLVRASRADVVIVDHLQQILTRGESRAYGLERVLARLPRQENKRVIITAQLNRQVEARRAMPTLADLRDSGAIEQAARQAWLLYWPSKHDDHEDPAEYRVNIAKNSEGPTGIVRLRWDPSSGRFWDPSEG